MSEKERIEEIILLEGLNSGDFAKEIGVQTSTLSHILNERNKPSLDVMRKILNRYQNINSDWLILGQGEMLRDKSQSKAANLFEMSDESSLESDSYITKETKKQDSEFTPSVVKHENTPSNVASEPQDFSSRVQSSVDPAIYARSYPKIEDKPEKKIERVIVYFTDNTFQEFESK